MSQLGVITYLHSPTGHQRFQLVYMGTGIGFLLTSKLQGTIKHWATSTAFCIWKPPPSFAEPGIKSLVLGWCQYKSVRHYNNDFLVSLCFRLLLCYPQYHFLVPLMKQKYQKRTNFDGNIWSADQKSVIYWQKTSVFMNLVLMDFCHLWTFSTPPWEFLSHKKKGFY